MANKIEMLEEMGLTKPKGDNDDLVATLVKQVGDLAKELGELKENRNTALEDQYFRSTASTQLTIPEMPKPVEPNYEGLPDPIDDPIGYTKGVDAARAKAEEENAAAQDAYDEAVAAYEEQQQHQIQSLYNDFSEKYPEYAKNNSRVDYLAETIVAKKQKEGIDGMKYMLTGSRFFNDLISEYDKVFGSPEKSEDEEKPAVDELTGFRHGDELPLSRTDGIPGGTEPSSKSKEPSDSEEKGNMLDEVGSLQRASGFFGSG